MLGDPVMSCIGFRQIKKGHSIFMAGLHYNIQGKSPLQKPEPKLMVFRHPFGLIDYQDFDKFSFQNVFFFLKRPTT